MCVCVYNHVCAFNNITILWTEQKNYQPALKETMCLSTDSSCNQTRRRGEISEARGGGGRLHGRGCINYMGKIGPQSPQHIEPQTRSQFHLLQLNDNFYNKLQSYARTCIRILEKKTGCDVF